MTTRNAIPVSATDLGAVHPAPAVPAMPATSSTAPRLLRVLLVTPRYLPSVGGTELHTYEIARKLAAAGHDVTVLTAVRKEQLPAVEESDGVRILRVRAWPTRRDFYFAPGIYHTIVHGRWDVVHCQGYHTFVAPLAMAAAWRAKTPYVAMFHSGGHSSPWRTRLRGMQLLLLRPLLARAARLIAVSAFEVEFFGAQLRFPRERFVMVPHGIHPMSMPVLPGGDSGGPLIVSFGRLERYKGHHRVIAALPRVLEQCPDARLRLIGSGPFEGDLRRLAARLGVADRVDIVSIAASDREGMARALASATVVTLLSEYEARSLAVMEALMLRRPVLVADTSGLSEYAACGLAQAIPLESSPEDVAAALVGQIRQPHVPAAVRFPTWDECVAELVALYRSAMGTMSTGQP